MGAGLKSPTECGKIGEALVTRGINSDQRIPESAQHKPGCTPLTRGNGRGFINMNISPLMALCGEMSVPGAMRTFACPTRRPNLLPPGS